MALPMMAPAPVVTEPAAVVREVCEHQDQCRQFQHSLPGLIVLAQKRRATLARGLLKRADNTQRSRFLSEAPWREDEVTRRRIRFMRHQTKPPRRRQRESRLAIDETLGEHGGSRFADVDRHAHPRDGTYPWAHQPVTGFSVRGPVRFPVGLRLYRRAEELTPWDAYGAKPCSERKIPPAKQARHRLHKPGEPGWLQAPEFQARPEPLRPQLALALEVVEEAIRSQVPVGVVVFDAWYLAEDGVRVWARRRKAWVRRLPTNRLRETASVQLRAINGGAMQLPGPIAQLRHSCRGSRPRPIAPSPSASTPPGAAPCGSASPAWARCASS